MSLIAAARAPSQVSHLVLWWISGGPIGLMQLATFYCGESAILASQGGMAVVAASPAWAEQIQRHPANRDILLQQDVEQFIATLQRWAAVYAPSTESPAPGMTSDDVACLTMPTLILRSGRSDLSHPRRASEWVHELLPNAQLLEPPWPDQEWNTRLTASLQGKGGLFVNWPQLAPLILAFTTRCGVSACWWLIDRADHTAHTDDEQ